MNHNPASTLVLAMTSYAFYLDAAGHPSSTPILCTGGFLANEPSWLAFEPAWKAALKKHGLLDVFHMTDFEHQFADASIRPRESPPRST
jgi:hypothetical protein